MPRHLGLPNLAETLSPSLVATSEQHRWSHAPSATSSARIRRPPRPAGAPATIAIVLALSTSRLRFLHVTPLAELSVTYVIYMLLPGYLF